MKMNLVLFFISNCKYVLKFFFQIMDLKTKNLKNNCFNVPVPGKAKRNENNL